MTTLAQTVAGSSISISAALPATYNQAGFSALSFTEVAEVVDMGEIGKAFNLVTHNPVNRRQTYKFKSSYNSGSQSLSLGKAVDDAGQVLMTAARDSDASYSFKIVFQDLSVAYYTGKVMSFVTTIGSVDTILGATAVVEIDSDITEVAAP